MLLLATKLKKDKVMHLLECLKDDFSLVYSQGGRLSHKPSSTADWMDGLEEEKISLELNGTSWVWGALDQESEWACSIDDCNRTGGSDDAHIEFKIQTVMSNALYGRCLRSIGSAPSSEPPSSSEDVELSEKLTSYRKRHLELWLRYLAMHPILSKAKYIHDFLLLNGTEWASRVGDLKVPEKSILGYVNSLVAFPGILERSERIEEIEMNARKLEKAIGDMRKLFVAEQKLFSEEEFRAQSWNEIFSKAARVFNARASSWNLNTEHFDEVNSILEEFSKTVKRLRKLAAVSTINKEKAQSDETILKALSVEAEFHWVLKNQTGRLAIELADFCESHAELLVNDADLCYKATDVLIIKPRYDM
ncbi:Sorting nexin-4 [Taenia solium]|eukprot:TsM_000456700 transcript=TsM_000456700 gene=TsM_000456700